MDTRDQQQAIVDRLLGNTGKRLPPLDALDEPWRTFYRGVKRASNFTEAELMVFGIANDMGDGTWNRDEPAFDLARHLVNMFPSGDHFTASPSLLEMQKRFTGVRWLWPGWIPCGMVTLLGAAPGMGKSLLALDLARRIIAGAPWPDGQAGHEGEPRGSTPGLRARNVLIVDAEGAPALLNQRAQAWDLDPRRLFLLLAPQEVGLIDLAAPPHQELLREMTYDVQPALIVVDSLAAAASRGETTLEGARAILGFLAGLARQYNAGMLVIHHLRKRAGASRPGFRPAAEDLRGSSHLSAAARSVLAMSYQESRSWPGLQAALVSHGLAPAAGQAALVSHGLAPAAGPPPRGRRLEVVKTNLCEPPPALVITLEAAADAQGAMGRLVCQEAPPDHPPPTQTERCAVWLVEYLAAAAAAPRPREVIAAAREEAGFSQATVYRARLALGPAVVDVGQSRYDPGKRWALASASR